MEPYNEDSRKAVKHLQVADHILTQTYLLVKDPKLLVVVVDNLHKATSKAMEAILGLERHDKKIPPFHDSFADRLRVFRARNMRRYGFNKGYLDLLQELYELVKEHQAAPVEFARKDKYVMADEDFELSQLTPDGLRKQLEMAKLFIEDMRQWMREHERATR